MGVFNSFSGRLSAWVLLGCLLLQLATLWLVRSAILQHGHDLATQQLATGERALTALLQQRHLNKKQAAQALVADLRFRETLIARDQSAIQLALQQLQAKMQAGLVDYRSADGALHLQGVSAAVLPDLPQQPAAAKSPQLKFVVIGQTTYQLVAVPVTASPTLIGTLVLGFPLDAAILSPGSQADGLAVSLWYQVPGRPWQLSASTLSLDAAQPSLAAIHAVAATRIKRQQTTLQQHQSLLLLKPLSTDAPTALLLVMQVGAPALVHRLTHMFSQLFVLACLGLAGLMALLWWRLKPLETCLQGLTGAASQMTHEHYQQPLLLRSPAGLHTVLQAFERMRLAVLARSQQWQALALQEPLTGLPNRRALLQTLTQHSRSAAEASQGFSLVCLQAEGLRSLHPAQAEVVLQQLVAQLQAALQGPPASLAMLDSDTFALLLPQEAAPAMQYIDGLRKVLEAPRQLELQQVRLQVRAGVAAFPEHGRQPALLLQRAQLAMLTTLKSGKSRCAVYQNSIEAEPKALHASLSAAISQKQLLFYLQPVIDISSRRVIAVEALLRWVHPEKGLLLPEQFLPLMEQAGLVHQLTAWMVRTACASLASFHQAGLPLQLLLNVSASDLQNPALPALVTRALQAHGLPLTALALEFSEDALMQENQRAESVVRQLAAQGIALALDDFGTGYTSLLHLRRLTIHTLKVDQRFVTQMDHNLADYAIAKSVIDLAHNLGLNVVAEGVESEQVLLQLLTLGCHRAQGHLIAKPMPEHDFPVWLARWNSEQVIDTDIALDGL